MELPCYVERKVELVEITEEEVWTILKRMNKGRAPAIDEVRTEMLIAAGECGVSWMKRLLNICTSPIPEDWRTGLSVLVWKGKGDVSDLGK